MSERLASWMNWVAFCDSSLNSTPRALARMPSGYPCSWAQPVTRDGSVQRLELVEFGAVDDAGDHLTRIERDAQIRGHDADQLLGVEQRLGHRLRLRVPV